ncbi:MAG TPA: FtsX-like permease family protein [Thermoleophilaceae bacterium]|nr:FtsX-like permease family protein [Thermoleophilaceae bacterium]
MRLSNTLFLYRTRLRSRLVQELLALAGITIGVALVFAALVANSSLTGSVRQLTEGIVGEADFQLVARGPIGIDERLVGEVRRLVGVEAAAPVLEARANVIGPDGRRSIQLFGGDPRFVEIGGPLLEVFATDSPQEARVLSGQQGLAIPEPMTKALGILPAHPFQLEIGSRRVHVPVALSLPRDAIGPLVDSPVAIAPLAYAQEIADLKGRVSRIFVKPVAGRERQVERALERVAAGRANVRDADADVAIFENAAYPTNQSTTLFSVFSALVGFLFAFSAMLLTAQQRRGLVADMRIAGHTTWSCVQVLLFDALVLGVLGSTLGIALGDQVSRHLFDAVPGYLAFAFPLGDQRVVTWQSVAIAGGAGVLAACFALLAPLRDMTLEHPLVSRSRLKLQRTQRALALAGLAALFATTVILVAYPDAAIAGIVSLTLALLLLLPLLLRSTMLVLALVVRGMKSVVPTLAILELRSRSAQTRTLAVAATGAIAVFATVSIGGAHADLQRGLDASAREIDGVADIWATFPGTPNAFATTPFEATPAMLDATERLPGVRAVRTYRGGFLDLGNRRAWVLAPPAAVAMPVPPSQIEKGELDEIAARVRSGGWVTVSEAIAKDYDVGVGDSIVLPTPRPTPTRVAAVTTNLGWPPGAVVLNADDYAKAWGSEAASAVHIDVAPGASPDRVAGVVRQTLGAELPLRVETRAERVDRHFAAARQGLSRLTQISALVLISAILAMAIAMAGMIWQRRPTVAKLKVHGYSERELWGALMVESGVLLGAGCVAGALFGLYGQLLLSRALQTITGFPVTYSAAGLTALAILALVTAVALAMLALPGWLAVRIRPTPGLTS